MSFEKKVEQEPVDDRIQLLRQLSSLFNENGIRWWVTGGFALEVNLGENSLLRHHGDIDVFIPDADIEKAEKILRDSGLTLERDLPFRIKVMKGEEKLADILNYKFTEEGGAILETQAEIGRDIAYPASVFEKQTRPYFGANVYVVRPELVYLQLKNSQRPRENDGADLKLLEKIIDPQFAEQLDKVKPYLTGDDFKEYERRLGNSS